MIISFLNRVRRNPTGFCAAPAPRLAGRYFSAECLA